ncbi:hypothetical protein JNL27_15220, partial [bacterium]|nr:hypothetical protein [bacterium]
MICFVSPSAFAGGDSLNADRIIEKVKDASMQARLKSYKLKSYTKSFLTVFNTEKNRNETEAVTLVHSDLYWKKSEQRREIETAYRHIHKPKFVEYDDFDFGMIDDFSQSKITVNNTSVVGPLSKGSEKYYQFQFLDTVIENGLPA